MRRLTRIVVAIAALAPGIAGAEVRVDWAAGRVTATGIGLADRQAPNPAVARGPARRKAEEAARAELAKAVTSLPLAEGGTLADALAKAPKADASGASNPNAATSPAKSADSMQARVDHAVASALVVDAEPDTDGSWRVTMAVPTEAIRQAIAGSRALGAKGDAAAPAVVVVEGVRAKPAVGFTVGGLAAATIWVESVPAWAKDAPRIKATRTQGAAIEAPIGKATEATLFVITGAR